MSTGLARCCVLSTSLARCCLLICLGLLTLLAGAAISLKGSTYHFVYTNSNSSGTYGYGAEGIGFLPLHLNHAAPAALTMTAGGITLFCSGIALKLIVSEWPRSRLFNHQISITLMIQALFVFIAFADVFVVHAISAHFDPSYRSPKNDAFGPGAYYEKGTFDLETWTCDLAGKPVKAMGNSYQTQCLVEKASRWILIPMFIFSVAALLPLDLRPATEGSRNGSTKQEEGDELEARHESR